jgi:glycosyltransferase involved in cell wall biosynthesis
MFYGVPIVAYGSSAVRGTLEPAGLVWDTPDPAALAASAWLIRSNAAARDALVESQRQHYVRNYSPSAIEKSFADALAPLLSEVAVCV